MPRATTSWLIIDLTIAFKTFSRFNILFLLGWILYWRKQPMTSQMRKVNATIQNSTKKVRFVTTTWNLPSLVSEKVFVLWIIDWKSHRLKILTEIIHNRMPHTLPKSISSTEDLNNPKVAMFKSLCEKTHGNFMIWDYLVIPYIRA